MDIPKVIHYIWVGPKPITALAKQCIKSWEKHLPEYEIKLWNEENSPMDNQYVQAMYAQGMWAFVADYIRFWVLEREGGIYLDTDTEVLKSFDSLLHHSVFFGKTKDGMTAVGVIGAKPHHRCFNDILKIYNDDTEYSVQNTAPKIVTDILKKKQYMDVVSYDYQYFNPCDDGEFCTSKKLSLAYTRNHWAESWVQFRKLRKFMRRTGIMSFLKSLKTYFNFTV